jgi:hypothetical protein
LLPHLKETLSVRIDKTSVGKRQKPKKQKNETEFLFLHKCNKKKPKKAKEPTHQLKPNKEKAPYQ